jgi:hypothetical protein
VDEFGPKSWAAFENAVLHDCRKSAWEGKSNVCLYHGKDSS